MHDQPTRRAFLGTTAAAAAGWAGTRLNTADAAPKRGANETIKLGLIGCGARGRSLVRAFKQLPGAQFVVVCDLHSAHLAQGQKETGGEKIRAYHDFRRLIEDKDVDAVIIATQAHWHVLPIIAACQAGKDVYCEKPLGNSIGEGKFAIQAAKKYDRIVQIGTQQRSQEHYQKAVEIVQSGKLGEISEVKVWDYENWFPGRGFPADCDPPKELDWDFYVGPAPMRRYNPNCFYNYGYDWFRLSGAGHQLAWAVHHYDVVNWAMKVKYPVAATAMGGNFAFQDNREWPNTFSGILEYGPGPVSKNGFIMQYTMRIGCKRHRRAHAKCFFGTEASMLVDRSRYSIVTEKSGDKKVVEQGDLINKEEDGLAANDPERHAEVFLKNVREHKIPTANTETGHHASNAGHLMNVAYLAGRRIRWDGQKEQVIDDPEANALVTKPYRAPWKLEV